MNKTMQVGKVGVDSCTDTVLRLELPSASASKNAKRKWSAISEPLGDEADCLLTLGIGRPSSSSGLDFDLNLGNEEYQDAKKARVRCDLELSLSTVPVESTLTSVSLDLNSVHIDLEAPVIGSTVPRVDEGSTSMGNAAAQWDAMLNTQGDYIADRVIEKSDRMMVISKASTDSAFGVPQQPHRGGNSKMCMFYGCGKRARGTSGFCIAHGGGPRCQKDGCSKGAEGRTAYCKAHGGGRRCQYIGCIKSAEGRTDYCIAHGGGKRCGREGCTRSARGKSGLCIRHGGGKRCQRENCTKSAEGVSGLCIAHGGGRRCQFPQCTKGAQGTTMLCKAHGGGKRCTALGCTKGAEGSTGFCKSHGGGKRCSFQGGGVCPKSVHGGTLFCVAHGGGKRCAASECTKSARGRTDYCVRHGGGKRCKSEGCGKSAQGSTDFCKAHGGGKRCAWVQSGFELSDQIGETCNHIALGKTGLCALHSALVQDAQVHGGGTLRPTNTDIKPITIKKMKQILIPEDTLANAVNFSGFGQAERPPQLPPQVPIEPVALPEGRVHGGNLMLMLARGSGF